MELKLSADAKPKMVAVEIQRRQKLVCRIDQQIAYVGQMLEGQVPRAAWAWKDDTGKYFLPIKYGSHPIELQKGKFSIECLDIDGLEHALCRVRAMTLEGDFDTQLDAIAGQVRSKFKKQ